MADFTFATITFNHENYIIDHLESIKYLISKYGYGRQFELIISDDCSTDNTLYFCKEWTNLNRKLFQNIIILNNTTNCGIVANWLKSINSITSAKYKMLAGDDFYYCNDLFNIMGDYDLVSSYPLALKNNEVSKAITDRFIYRCSKLQNMGSDWLKKYIKNGENYLYTPAVFYNIELTKDRKAQEYISKYKYLEDVTLHYYLFVLSQKKIRINYHDSPYVYYRVDSGVSQSNDSTYKTDYLQEYDLFRKNIGVSMLAKIIRSLNIQYYKREVYFKIRGSKSSKIFLEKKTQHKNYLKVFETAGAHLDIIRQNVKKSRELIQI